MSNPFLAAVNKYKLIEKNDSVAVALSGGADSVSLLHMLCSVKEKYNLTLYAIHINHMIRGEEAERDEEFCREFCKKNKCSVNSGERKNQYGALWKECQI